MFSVYRYLCNCKATSKQIVSLLLNRNCLCSRFLSTSLEQGAAQLLGNLMMNVNTELWF